MCHELASCSAGKKLWPLVCSLPASLQEGGQRVGWEQLGRIRPPRCLWDDGCGVGEGTELLTQAALSAPTHARAGKRPELWNGCVTAAPRWCDRHMIFLWCLLLKDKHLPYFFFFLNELQNSGQGWLSFVLKTRQRNLVLCFYGSWWFENDPGSDTTA